jgi:hypothetical protein
VRKLKSNEKIKELSNWLRQVEKDDGWVDSLDLSIRNSFRDLGGLCMYPKNQLSKSKAPEYNTAKGLRAHQPIRGETKQLIMKTSHSPTLEGDDIKDASSEEKPKEGRRNIQFQHLISQPTTQSDVLTRILLHGNGKY